MLYELYIENLAVIESAHIPFSNSFNVFTGETGAGKSILINGINGILGQRVTKDIVRTGAKKATITGLFTNLSSTICAKLDELNISHDENMITITREVLADGGSIARINSRAVAISVLKEVGQLLVNVHGQHDNQILLNPDKHLDIIDAFGGDTTLLVSYRESFKHLQALARKIGELKKIQKVKLDRLEILNARITEIGALDIQPDEDVQIDKEYEVCLNAEKVVSALDEAYKLLNTLDNSAMESIQNAKHTIERYSDVVNEISPLVDRLNNAHIEIQDVSEELLILSHSIDLDKSRLEYLAQRRLDLNHIKKKYSLDLNGVLELYQSALEEVNTLNNSSRRVV